MSEMDTLEGAINEIQEMALNHLWAAKSFLSWKVAGFYTEEEFMERLRYNNRTYACAWLMRFGCSWCGERATHNLNSSDMCCDIHWEQWFKNLALNPDDF